MIELTNEAIAKIKSMHADQGLDSETGIRFLITEGGCSGFEYGMTFDSAKEADSRAMVDGILVLVDPKSLERLDNVKVHFDDGLQGKGFEFTNPNASSTCGCGKSFS